MYQVIARKYRPQTFDKVVGQDHVKRTLCNAIDQGRIAHGYIFSGPRGTGKTTMARILAMALNFEDGPSSSLDPETTVCKEIASGASIDVVEIDAASNRRIDDIRELRQSVRFRPVRDRYKVFIIDEAHQITSDAFNALLKTLEEPPEWAVFVLCTTEPQAIPATIASRCQSFAFQAIAQAEVLRHLRTICKSEGVEADDDALAALALAGDGSIRDSLSALDQSIAAFGQRLESGEVRDLLGAIPSEMSERILTAIRDADPAGMLGVVDNLFRTGRHPQHFCGELTRQFRNLMVMKVGGPDTRLVTAGPGEREAARAWLAEFSIEDLTRYVQILLALYQDLQQTMQQRFRLEVGLLKLVYAGRLRPIEEVLSGLGQASRRGPPRPPGGSQPVAAGPRADRRAGRHAGPAKSSTAPSIPTSDGSREPDSVAQPTSGETVSEVSSGPQPAASGAETSAPEPQADRSSRSSTTATEAPPTAKDASGGEQLKALLRSIEETGESFLSDALRSSRLEVDGLAVTIHIPEEWMAMVELQEPVLEAALLGIVGGKPDVRLVVDSGQQTGQGKAQRRRIVAAEPTDRPARIDARQRAQEDPAVLEYRKRFHGRVASVTDLRERTK